MQSEICEEKMPLIMGDLTKELSRRLFVFVTALAFVLPTITFAATKEQFESLFAERTLFVSKEPYYKQKRMIDLEGITRDEDVAVIREAVNPIIFFLIRFGQETGPSTKFDGIVTAEGAKRLKRPHIPTGGKHHYFSEAKKNWKVIDPKTLSLDVKFVDSFNPKTDEYNFVVHFVFVKQDGRWKFDRHED